MSAGDNCDHRLFSWAAKKSVLLLNHYFSQLFLLLKKLRWRAGVVSSTTEVNVALLSDGKPEITYLRNSVSILPIDTVSERKGIQGCGGDSVGKGTALPA